MGDDNNRAATLRDESRYVSRRATEAKVRLDKRMDKTEAQLEKFQKVIEKDALPELPLAEQEKTYPDGEISKARVIALKEMFLMDGITYTQAAKLAGVNPKTAREKFMAWAQELVEDENYEGWVQRQQRVRARALEGITKQILSVQEHLDTLQRIYNGIVFVPPGIAADGQPTEARIKPVEEIDHTAQRVYAAQIQEVQQMLGNLRAESLVIQSAPPPDVILDREIEQAIASRVNPKLTDSPESD